MARSSKKLLSIGIGLYSSDRKLQFPLSSLTLDFKVTNVRQVMMMRDNADEKVRGPRVEVNIGQK
ncbi:hypothetical protein DPMN_070744 [Dreissena polymorpha]|uniref:Uncharacterized protein n=1 Tax=Dreissena polymorpha TaxID=45954 RepID=A0A9D4BVW2_DREPO|nr:hypothetical protein DPMN_070744 [Dreissena polymorpha]